jgi:glyoxylase-like metal-dependent hydrolase (beta-lactamase superfamily II)
VAGGPFAWEVLIPAHRIVLGLMGGEVVETRAGSSAATFAAYRKLDGAVPGMIAWPNTVLLTGPETIVVDPGYQTQGDMLAGVLLARGITPDTIHTVVMTHLHSDHLSALPQLPGTTDVWVHEAELDTPYARRQKGILDEVSLRVMSGAEGEIRPGLTWIHTPGHAPGHIAVIAECAAERVVIAGDTLGPDPRWFDDMNPPQGLDERAAHLRAFEAIRALAPAVVVPGHNPPFRLP